MLKASSFPQD